MSAVSLSAVLLTGGESQRMGRDKATLDFCGKPLWQNQLAILKQLKPLEIFVSARTDPPWRPAETIFVGDKFPSIGPVSGISAALRNMRGSHLLVLAIDLPYMTAEYLKSLYDKTAAYLGVVPMVGDRADPLAAIYSVDAAADFTAAACGNDHSLQHIIRGLSQSGRVRLVAVTPDEKILFRNLNSPADLV